VEGRNGKWGGVRDRCSGRVRWSRRDGQWEEDGKWEMDGSWNARVGDGSGKARVGGRRQWEGVVGDENRWWRAKKDPLCLVRAMERWLVPKKGRCRANRIVFGRQRGCG
jgi:hypothetical protein